MCGAVLDGTPFAGRKAELEANDGRREGAIKETKKQLGDDRAGLPGRRGHGRVNPREKKRRLPRRHSPRVPRDKD